VLLNPQLRQAARALYAIWRQLVEQENFSEIPDKFTEKTEKEQFAGFVFSCSLRSHHKTHPPPKNAYCHYLALTTCHPKQEK
jgi:hypothetical protein